MAQWQQMAAVPLHRLVVPWTHPASHPCRSSQQCSFSVEPPTAARWLEMEMMAQILTPTLQLMTRSRGRGAAAFSLLRRHQLRARRWYLCAKPAAAVTTGEAAQHQRTPHHRHHHRHLLRRRVTTTKATLCWATLKPSPLRWRTLSAAICSGCMSRTAAGMASGRRLPTPP